MSISKNRNSIYGIDFSGAKNACKKIWVSRGNVVGDTLHIDECFRIAEKISSVNQVRPGRDECLAALRDIIVKDEDSVFGIDLSFSIPEALIVEGDWESFILSFPSKYDSAQQFRESCRNMAGGKELKRVSEVKSKVPFSVYNLRLYRQTYFGIRDMLYPLVMEGLACILPMQDAKSGKPWLIETCPACRLKKEGMYIPYKGKNDIELDARVRILEHFMKKGLVISSKLQVKIQEDPEGDALDSIIAAYSTFRSMDMVSDISGTLQGNYMVEGYTFF
ncbi:hypothetical protein V7O66_09560 [Methanolobus sp. ZRKC3]|uniref:hypothetical protein n=1 Tax=Methanolobus sp. ZRKC3 TaxID=3125786 RepID=UPI003248E437